MKKSVHPPMKAKLYLSRLCSGALCAALMVGLSLSGFAHSAVIEISGDNKYKKLMLPPEVETRSNLDFSDLRITDAAGETVPYFILNSEMESTETGENYLLNKIDSFKKDDSLFFDFALSETPDRDIQASSIRFNTTDKDFVKQVKLYGGYDGLSWEHCGDGTLYDVQSQQAMEIVFDSPLKYTHYRMEVDSASVPVNFNSAKLIYEHKLVAKSPFLQSLEVTSSTENNDSETVITLQNIRGIKLHSISVDASGTFLRKVYLPNGSSDTIYSLDFNGADVKSTTLSLDGYSTSQDTLELSIENHDDKPLDISSISAVHLASYIVFDGTGAAPYTLTFTGDSATTAPRYDIQSYSENVLTEAIDTLELGELDLDSDAEDPPPEKDYTVVFNVVIIVLALALAVIIVVTMRKRDNS